MFLTSTRRVARGPFSRLSPVAAWKAQPSRLAQVQFYSVVTDAPVPRKGKVWDSIDEAVQVVKSGDTLLSGGMFVLWCERVVGREC